MTTPVTARAADPARFVPGTGPGEPIQRRDLRLLDDSGLAEDRALAFVQTPVAGGRVTELGAPPTAGEA